MLFDCLFSFVHVCYVNQQAMCRLKINASYGGTYLQIEYPKEIYESDESVQKTIKKIVRKHDGFYRIREEHQNYQVEIFLSNEKIV